MIPLCFAISGIYALERALRPKISIGLISLAWEFRPIP